MPESQPVVVSVLLLGDRAQLLGTEPLVLDGLEPKQLEVANEASNAAKAAGVSVPKKQILRLTAFLEGGPIPPA